MNRDWLWVVFWLAVLFGPLILGPILYGHHTPSIWVELVDYIRERRRRAR